VSLLNADQGGLKTTYTQPKLGLRIVGSNGKLLRREQNPAIDLLTIGLYTADLALALDPWSGPRIISRKFVGRKGPPQRDRRKLQLGKVAVGLLNKEVAQLVFSKDTRLTKQAD
jgi:hypothetical protein